MKKINVKAAYSKKVEKDVRSLSYYLSVILKDYKAINAKQVFEAAEAAEAAAKTKEEKAAAKQQKQEAKKAAEAAAKYISEAEADRIDFAKQVFENGKYTEENISISYIKNWYPFINSASQICDVKKIAAEEEAEYRQKAEAIKAEAKEAGKTEAEAAAEAAKKGFEFAYNSENILIRLIPCEIFTCNKVLTKIAAAKKAEEAKRKEASKAAEELAAAKKEAAKIEALKIRLAELEAKQAKRKEAAEASKAA